MFDLEHPDITSALATGYPRTATHHTIECESCGAELAGEDDVFILEGQHYVAIAARTLSWITTQSGSCATICALPM